MKRDASLKEFYVGERKISYVLRRSARARSLRLAVLHDGAVTLTLPMRMSEIFGERFVRTKVHWVIAKIDEMQRRPSSPISHLGRRDYLANKVAAHALVKTKIAAINEHYNFRYLAITIRNQRTRWGSCSRRGNLNFNFRILFLPEPLQDYLIVHELCHLAQMNHSKKFWSLVARTIPNYKTLRRELRTKARPS